jgi:hypothetical protein
LVELDAHELAPGAALFVSAISVCACWSQQKCDTVPYNRCAGGVLFAGGCGAADAVVGHCARGCKEEGIIAGYSACPFALCRENEPKKAGDACEAPDDCEPTRAVVSMFNVTNTYLACDATTQMCVNAAPAVIADWLQPCTAALIAQMTADGQDYGFDTAVPDSGCSEKWCAVYRETGTSCVANACTRSCRGDQDCPQGSTCQRAVPAGCAADLPTYCKPGGPAAIGFTCR